MAEVDGKKLKLMVVDDEYDNLDLLYRTFRRDFQVYRADNARAALAILDTAGEMAVIISDQRMPEMNGTEFLSLTVERFPDTIRILLTGFTDAEDLVEAINSGQVFKYITKPWDPQKLQDVVSQAAETYRIVKHSTKMLRRALRRESAFNAVITAVRESLDYRSMLQRIVETMGQTFEMSGCLLRPVENDRKLPPATVDLMALDGGYNGGDRLSDDLFFYKEHNCPPSCISLHSDCLFYQVLQSRTYQLTHGVQDGQFYYQLVIPLIYQHQLLAILGLYYKEDNPTPTQPDQPFPWQSEDIQLITSVAEQAALALSQAKLYQRLQAQQEQLRAELEVARQIQNNLLRQTLPEINQAKVQACCYPAREVGGDFFEVFVHPHGDLWLAVGDVSGKGVPAALFMASAISVLRRELSQETPAQPNTVLQNLNHSLSPDLISNNCFITIVLARYTPSTRELVYANAGHIYPLIWSTLLGQQQQPNYLKVRGIPLGIRENWQASSGQLTLAVGDILLLASDGITEASVIKNSANNVNPTDDAQPVRRSMLNQEGLWQLLLQEPQPLSLQHLIDRIQADNDVREDDQTILSLEVF